MQKCKNGASKKAKRNNCKPTPKQPLPTVNIELLDAPTDLMGNLDGHSLILKWKDNSSNEDGFIIEPYPSNGEGYYTKANTTIHSVNVSPGAEYAFHVKAFNSTGASGYSNVFRIAIPKEQVLTDPSNLTLKELFSTGKTRARLTWQDNSKSEELFKIAFSVDNDQQFFESAYAKENATTFDTWELKPGRLYFAKVAACSKTSGHCSAYSNILKFRIPDDTGWYHSYNPYDVDANGRLTEDDAQSVIDAMNNLGEGAFPHDNPGLEYHFVDVNNDGILSPVDAILVINYLNQPGWHNATIPYDVDLDGLITEDDALAIINELDNNGARPLPEEAPSERHYYFDVNDDKSVSPLDAILIINYLNSNGV
ncbi:MAG: hypothetical protein J5J00_05455 [Deltaproteobacteria bacterium]|nr:hypothetical protein [Deltaproteobacteria bacterium]